MTADILTSYTPQEIEEKRKAARLALSGIKTPNTAAAKAAVKKIATSFIPPHENLTRKDIFSSLSPQEIKLKRLEAKQALGDTPSPSYKKTRDLKLRHTIKKMEKESLQRAAEFARHISPENQNNETQGRFSHTHQENTPHPVNTRRAAPLTQPPDQPALVKTLSTQNILQQKISSKKTVSAPSPRNYQNNPIVFILFGLTVIIGIGSGMFLIIWSSKQQPQTPSPVSPHNIETSTNLLPLQTHVTLPFEDKGGVDTLRKNLLSVLKKDNFQGGMIRIIPVENKLAIPAKKFLSTISAPLQLIYAVEDNFLFASAPPYNSFFLILFPTSFENALNGVRQWEINPHALYAALSPLNPFPPTNTLWTWQNTTIENINARYGHDPNNKDVSLYISFIRKNILLITPDISLFKTVIKSLN